MRATSLAVLSKRGRAGLVSLFYTLLTMRALVLGCLGELRRRVQGAERNVAAARARAEERRKETLGTQRVVERRGNTFRDRRFGGNEEDGMDARDAAMARFMRERQKRAKRGAKYLLTDDAPEEDGGGEALTLTHGGRSLTDTLEGDRRGPWPTGEEEDWEAQEEAMAAMQFGAGGEARNRNRSHAEIMAEVVAKSKAFRAERAREKIAREAQLEDLDKAADDVRALLGVSTADEKRAAAAAVKDPYAAFDAEVAALSMEAREAHATDRLKSAEELAKEERERLEKAEAARQQRMLGSGDGSNADSRRRTDDDVDMGADFDLPVDYWKTGMSDSDDNDGSGGSDSDGDGDDGTSSAGESDSDEDNSDSSHSDNDGVRGAKLRRVSSRGGAGKGSADGPSVAKRSRLEGPDADDTTVGDSGNMPFVIKCPTDVASWAALLRKYCRTADDVRELCRRIRGSNNIHLRAENRPALMRWHDAALTHLAECVDRDGEAAGVVEGGARALADGLVSTLRELAAESTSLAQASWRTVVTGLRAKLVRAGAERAAGIDWPGAGALLVVYAATKVWSVSDFRHGIATPLSLVLAQCLAQAPLRSPRDVAAAVSTAATLLQIHQASRRVVPEVVALARVIFCVVAGETLEGPRSEDVKALRWLREGVQAGGDESSASEESSDGLGVLGLASTAPTEKGEEPPASMCRTLYRAFTRLAVAAADLYAHLDSAPALLGECRDALTAVDPSVLSALDGTRAAHEAAVSKVEEVIATRVAERKPLQLQAEARKPVPVRSLEPMVEEHFAMRKDKTAVGKRAEAKRLARAVKRERRGAARELRRDSEFIARERLREREERDAEREQRGREVMALLQEQQATFNQQVKLGGGLRGGGSAGAGSAKAKKDKK